MVCSHVQKWVHVSSHESQPLVHRAHGFLRADQALIGQFFVLHSDSAQDITLMR